MSNQELRLEEMRLRANAAAAYGMHNETPLARDVLRLVAEVERLQARDAFAHECIELLSERAALLTEQNTALREVARAVAEADNSDHSICYQLCEIEWHGHRDEDGWQDIRHVEPCVVEQAQKAQKALGGVGDGVS